MKGNDEVLDDDLKRINVKPSRMLTFTVSGLVGQAVKRIHGTGRPTRMSKMLLPMELETAISPSPMRATITLVSKSGTEVPAARNVNPMIIDGMPKVAPMVSAQSTMKYEYPPIHAMDKINDK